MLLCVSQAKPVAEAGSLVYPAQPGLVVEHAGDVAHSAGAVHVAKREAEDGSEPEPEPESEPEAED